MQNPQTFSVDPLGGKRASVPSGYAHSVPNSRRKQDCGERGVGMGIWNTSVSVPGTLVFASKNLTAQGNKKECGTERAMGEAQGEAGEAGRLRRVTG